MQRDIAKLREEHDYELDKLDRKVKMEVATKDEDISILRDAVHTEKLKGKKLRTLLRQYSGEGGSV